MKIKYRYTGIKSEENKEVDSIYLESSEIEKALGEIDKYGMFFSTVDLRIAHNYESYNFKIFKDCITENLYLLSGEKYRICTLNKNEKPYRKAVDLSELIMQQLNN